MKHIVILGAGFGGLRAALLIGRKIKSRGLTKEYQVILVDKNASHTYTPLLYEVATTSRETADFRRLCEVTTHPILEIIKGLPIIFVQGEVEDIDVKNRLVPLTTGLKVKFDHLIIALGSETNYHGIHNIKENSFSLKSFEDAMRIREKISDLAQNSQSQIKIVIGGGGSVGVELGAELKIWCGHLENEFKCRVSVAIIHSGAHVLSEFEDGISSIAERRLSQLGVEIIRNEKVVGLENGVVILKSGKRIPSSIFIWAGGVKAPELLSNLACKKDEDGYLLIDDTLSYAPRVYALGDGVSFTNPKTGEPIPKVARAAIIQGTVAAHNLWEDIEAERRGSRPNHTHYIPAEYPYITPVGAKYAVAKFGSLVVSGFWGWVLKGLVELNYLFSIMSPFRALKIWLKGLRIFMQNDRLG